MCMFVLYAASILIYYYADYSSGLNLYLYIYTYGFPFAHQPNNYMSNNYIYIPYMDPIGSYRLSDILTSYPKVRTIKCLNQGEAGKKTSKFLKWG